MSRALLAALCAVILSVFTSSSFASVVTYNETISGDLDLPFTTTFNFDFGVNSVDGSEAIASNGDSDLDGFQFVVPAAGTLTLANVDVWSGGGIPQLSWIFYKNGSPAETINVPVTGTKQFTTLPVGPGTYQVYPNQITGNGVGAYSFSFNVQQSVPEPGSLSLIAIANCGLLVRKRR